MFLSYQKTSLSRWVIYLTNLFISFHYFLVIYINSAFLSTYIGAQQLSLLYIVGSIVSILLFSLFTPIIQRVGNYHLTLLFITLELLALLGLALGNTVPFVTLSFIVYIAVSPIIYLNLDIFLEKSISNEGTTGRVRGMFLTMQNITQVTCPLLVAIFLYENEYWRIYLISILFLLAGLTIIMTYLYRFHDARYHPRTVWQSIRYLLRHPILYRVVAAQFALRFFFAWMVIYTPLYLFQTIGFSWPQLGIMFSIILTPFLLLELFLGKIIDGRLGERTVMVSGFFIMAITTILMSLLSEPIFILWAVVLFISRIGAACVEIATESYFFKHVDETLADTISLFRMARPVTYIAAASVTGLALQFISLRWSFLILTLVMLWGLSYAFALKETKP